MSPKARRFCCLGVCSEDCIEQGLDIEDMCAGCEAETRQLIIGMLRMSHAAMLELYREYIRKVGECYGCGAKREPCTDANDLPMPGRFAILHLANCPIEQAENVEGQVREVGGIGKVMAA